MPRTKSKVPPYCLHKPTGQAYVRVNGRFHSLGPHGSAQSREKYARLIAEWTSASKYSEPTNASPSGRITVVELITSYIKFIRTYYVDADGKPIA
jgi:hypothetical protein